MKEANTAKSDKKEHHNSILEKGTTLDDRFERTQLK